MAKENPLAIGIVGGNMVAYIAENAPEQGVPIEADCLETPFIDADSLNYRLSFDNGNVSDWKVTFDYKSTDILNMEQFNEVL